MQFPPASELNTRLRRLITSYQRNFKKEEMKMAQKAKRMERREKIETIVREREKQKIELQQRRWTRREEGDFFRTISNFGVEYNKKLGRYDWTRFRAISHLERKYDETLTEYLRAFCAMCKKACGRKLSDEEEVAQAMVEPISEDRARRCLERLELLCKIREEVLPHPKLEERLKLCQPSLDLPDWWICGKHDRDLLMGASRHGLGRTDFYYVHDPEIGYREVLRRHYAGEPLIYPQEKKDRDRIENPIVEEEIDEEELPVPAKIFKEADAEEKRSLKKIKSEDDVGRRKKTKKVKEEPEKKAESMEEGEEAISLKKEDKDEATGEKEQPADSVTEKEPEPESSADVAKEEEKTTNDDKEPEDVEEKKEEAPKSPAKVSEAAESETEEVKEPVVEKEALQDSDVTETESKPTEPVEEVEGNPTEESTESETADKDSDKDKSTMEVDEPTDKAPSYPSKPGKVAEVNGEAETKEAESMDVDQDQEIKSKEDDSTPSEVVKSPEPESTAAVEPSEVPKNEEKEENDKSSQVNFFRLFILFLITKFDFR